MLAGALLTGAFTALAAAMVWRRRPAWRADLLALLALTGVLAVFFAPVLFGGMWLPRGGGDLVSFLWPTYSFAARTLRAGGLPLWNPHLYSGAPFIADNQSGVFYPPNLALFLLAPQVTYEALQWLVIGHFWLAGAGMYACLRLLLSHPAAPRARILPALFGALAFMLSDVFVTHQGNLNLIAVAAYLPLVFLCVCSAATLRVTSANTQSRASLRVRWALAGGALLGVATLAGHAQMTLFLALTVGAVGLGAVLTRLREGPRAWLGVAALAALVGLVGGGLAAVALLPAAELTPHTLRASISYEEAARYSLPPQALIGLVAPWVIGRGPDHFSGDWERVEVGYAGALTRPLALYGAWRARRAPLARFLIVFGVAALLMALGEHTPLHRLAHTLPLMDSLRAPARFVLLFDFALAGLAALGLRAILQARPPARVRGLAGGARVALLAVELVANSAGIEVDAGDPYAGYDHPAVVAWLRAQPGVFRVEGAAPAWQPDAAAYHGLYDIYGVHNPLALASYESYYWSVGQRGTPQYNFLGARYVIRPKGDPPAGEPYAADFIPVFDDAPTLTVYENTRALPLAHVVPRAVAVASAEEAWGPLHAPDWDPTAQVYVEGGPPLAGEAGGDNRVEHLAYAPNRLVYAVETTGPAYLVLAEPYYPGWRATVDGAPAPIYRANLAFRAVYIEAAGAHTVELAFAPESFALGAAISALTLAALLGAGAWASARAMRRRRGNGGDRRPEGSLAPRPDDRTGGDRAASR